MFQWSCGCHQVCAIADEQNSIEQETFKEEFIDTVVQL